MPSIPQSGALRFAAGTDKTAIATGGNSPVAMASHLGLTPTSTSPTADNDSVVHFTIATDGTLTKKDSVTLSAPPVSIAVNQANSYLFVVSGTTSATLDGVPAVFRRHRRGRPPSRP